MVGLLRAGPALLAVCCISSGAYAQIGPLSEVRVGVLAHDVPVLGPQEEHGVDLNGELLFVSPVPDSWANMFGESWRWVAKPRPDIGFDANTSGQTSQGYFGLTWTPWHATGVLGTPGEMFFDFSFGGSVNNGQIYSSNDSRLNLGANLLFRESVELGYRFESGISISLFFDHTSNGGFDTYNDGLNNLGGRIGYRF